MSGPTTSREASDETEPFPDFVQATPEDHEDASPEPAPEVLPNSPRRRTSTRARRTRASSLLQDLIESNPPLGAWQAIGEDTAKAPTIPEIKNGSYDGAGWSHEGQLEQRNHAPHDIHARRLSKTCRTTDSIPSGPVNRLEPTQTQLPTEENAPVTDYTLIKQPSGPDATGTYPNGYRFPKKHTWKQSITLYAAAFWKFFWTIKGFLITIYALNVVAWGAMIFFLLIPGATPAMCKSYPDCNNKRYSARQIWIENCSQILTALFCVTAFGLLPWRARDFYYMVRYQTTHDQRAHRKLAGFYRGWYRLPGSDQLPETLGPPPKPADIRIDMFGNYKDPDTETHELDFTALETNPSVPLPPWSIPDAPLTGLRSPPTHFTVLALMVWMYMLNSFIQVGLCVVMWGFNRFQRNHAYFSALTALFIVLGCVTGIVAGVVVGRESKKVKTVEGVAVREYDVVESEDDFRERMAKVKSKEKGGSRRLK